MNPTFNLVDAPWIPCMRRDGQRIELGLRDVLARAHELQAISGETPAVTAALYRLLLAVLQRVYAPDSTRAWGVLWQCGRCDTARLNEYLGRWRHRFDLFDRVRPFYQAPDDRVKFKSVADLVLGKLSGATLFDHYTEADDFWFTPAQAARALITTQSFRFGGTKGSTLQFTDGSWARDVIFLADGNTLFETLVLNLVRCTDQDPMFNKPNDCPSWEMDDPFTPEREFPLGYLDYLTWQNRRILLKPEQGTEGVIVRQASMGPGLRLNVAALLEANQFEPMKLYKKNKRLGGYSPVRFDENRALWRDSASLFRFHKGVQQDADDVHVPYILTWLRALVSNYIIDPVATYRLMALGTASKSGRDVAYFYRMEHMPLPLDYLTDPDLVKDLGDALSVAEETANKLREAAEEMAKFVLSPEADSKNGRQPARENIQNLVKHWNVQRHYWADLELPFRTLMVRLPHDRVSALVAWQKVLRCAAWSTLEHAQAQIGGGPRVYKAGVKARGRLAAGLAKVLLA